MNIEDLKQVIEIPIKWYDKGSIEFMELSLLCESRPEIGEAELHERYNEWGRKLEAQKKIIRVLKIILLMLFVLMCFIRIPVIVILAGIMGSILTVVLRQASKRKKVIQDKLKYCYMWIYNEIVLPKKVLPPTQEIKATRSFNRFVFKERMKARKKKELFRSFISAYGYNEETLHN